MQVFVCSGWTENLRKWETWVPNPFCAWFKGWGSEWSSENRPDTLRPEFLPVKPMRCVLVFGLRVVFVTSFCPQSHPGHRHPGEGCWGQNTALSPNCCRSHVGLWVLVFKFWGGGKRRRMEPCSTLPKDHWQLLLKSCSAVATALSGLCLPALTMLNNKKSVFFAGTRACRQVQVIHMQYWGTTVHKPCTQTWWNQVKSLSHPVVLMWSWKCPQTSLKDTDPTVGTHKAGSGAARCTALWFSSFLYI